MNDTDTETRHKTPEAYLGKAAESFMAAVGDERDRLLELYEGYGVLMGHLQAVDTDRGGVTVERLSAGLRVVAHVPEIRHGYPMHDFIESDLTNVEPIRYTSEGHYRIEAVIDGPNAKGWPPLPSDEVAVSTDAARTAYEELNRLIEQTEGDDPDPLTDATFNARDELRDSLGFGEDA